MLTKLKCYETVGKQRQETISYIQEAINVLETSDIGQVTSGITLDQMKQLLASMQQDVAPSIKDPDSIDEHDLRAIPVDQIRVIADNTIAVLTFGEEKREEWKRTMELSLQEARMQRFQYEAEFFDAIVRLLNRQEATLPEYNPYSKAIQIIIREVKNAATSNFTEPNPVHPDIIANSIKALLGTIEEKMLHGQFLVDQVSQSQDAQLQLLVNTILRALFDGNLDSLGSGLEGVYAQAWASIITGVRNGESNQ